MQNKIEMSLNVIDRRLLERIAKALEEQNKLSKPATYTVRHDEQTLFKVRDSLLKVGLDDNEVDDSINEMLNAGILFRERGRP